MRFFRFLPILFLLASCSGPYVGKDVFGADEFVLDSYRIKEGKFSILEMEGKESADFDPKWLEEYPDQLCDGDVLEVVLHHPKRDDLVQSVQRINQSVGFRIDGGQVILPDLGLISVSGLTLEEARQKIQAAYRSHFADMDVFVAYKDRIERKVELAGLVQIPSVLVDGKTRLFEVLSKAKIPVDANLFKSYLVRQGQLLPVDFYKLLKEGDMSQNIALRGGDKIYIAEPSAASLMIMGEVGVERTLALPHGYVPLRQALAEARGIPFTGDKSYIQVIRGNITKPKIYTLNWEHVIHLPNESLLLMPGDIVYVAPKPITEWNRFVSQLLPSFSSLDVMWRNSSGVGIILP